MDIDNSDFIRRAYNERRKNPEEWLRALRLMKENRELLNKWAILVYLFFHHENPSYLNKEQKMEAVSLFKDYFDSVIAYYEKNDKRKAKLLKERFFLNQEIEELREKSKDFLNNGKAKNNKQKQLVAELE